MWKAMVFPLVSLKLLTASGPVTYWQENRCRENDLGGGASLRWCVEAIAFTEESAMELQVSWRSSGLSGKSLFKGSDSDNHRMYLRDDLGNRYDHVATRGAALDGGRLDDEHASLLEAKKRFMRKKGKSSVQDELRPEYDLSEILAHGVRGKYASRYRKGTNLVLLAPDVAKHFGHDDKAINDALRLVIELGKLSRIRKTG